MPAAVEPPIRIGLIGLGHWGPNLFRNFLEHEACEVVVVCDSDPAKQAKVERYGVPMVQDAEELFRASLDAVVIATPVASHEALAARALEQGLHVFVEKPLAASVAACERLVALAQARDRTLMVGHVFLYNPGVRYVKQLIDDGALGKLLFVYSRRTNLGPIRNDVNAFWDLASHDISIVDYWLGTRPTGVSATGSPLLDPRIEDVVNATLVYPGDMTCFLLASWLHPKKVRQITLVGERKMVIWDDVASNEPVRIYDKHVDVLRELPEQVTGTLAEFQFAIAEGDLSIPRVPRAEPLRVECEHFVECLLSGERPLSDGEDGLAVVRTLEAADRSIAARGAMADLV